MVKRVFAIIGIVLGSVAVFVGGVFGVMALMGKFKTPIVYPTVLQFEGETQLVLAGQDDPYCFVLKGENPNSEHEVNQKTCYIWFDQSTSTDLITLRDKDGNALVANESNRYKINCNEPVYYTINDNVDGKDGIVKIVARSEDEKVMPNNPLTLHIDREVKGVYVQRDNLDINETQLTQTIAVGLDQALEFDFVAKPSDYTRQPISVYPKKDVELYYASDVSDDFIKVTSETVAIAPLNEIMYEESGKFYFKSNDSSKRYTFNGRISCKI